MPNIFISTKELFYDVTNGELIKEGKEELQREAPGLALDLIKRNLTPTE